MPRSGRELQPGAPPGHSWLLLVVPGPLWIIPGCPPPTPTARKTRWACQGTGCPYPARRSSWPLLGALGLLLEAPGLLLAAPSHVGQDTQIQPGAPPGHSWVLLGCSWISWASNALRPVCQQAAKLLPTCAELAQECKGGMGGKPSVSQKTLNPKRE